LDGVDRRRPAVSKRIELLGAAISRARTPGLLS
jgi:hypothetical protein